MNFPASLMSIRGSRESGCRSDHHSYFPGDTCPWIRFRLFPNRRMNAYKLRSHKAGIVLHVPCCHKKHTAYIQCSNIIFDFGLTVKVLRCGDFSICHQGYTWEGRPYYLRYTFCNTSIGGCLPLSDFDVRRSFFPICATILSALVKQNRYLETKMYSLSLKKHYKNP